MNSLFFGDNLDVLRRHIATNSVDLIYLDPPFNSNATYSLIYKTPVGRVVDAQVRAFKDMWRWEEDAAPLALDEIRQRDVQLFRIMQALKASLGEGDMMAYLVMMAVRLLELHRALRPTGSLFLHCDPTASHYLKVILDAVFGPQNMRNEIIWQRTVGKALMTRRLPMNHDVILSFQKSAGAKWNSEEAFTKYDLDNLNEKTKSKYSHKDDAGRLYQLDNLINPNPNRPNLTYEFLGVTRVWRWSRERMEAAYRAGLVVQPRPGAVPRLKRYLDEQRGLPLGDVWTDVLPLNSQAQERLGYPTQKPLALMERILRLASDPGDVVLDPFCGCGTTIHAAEVLGRKWVGIDVAYAAIQVIQDRLSTHLSHAKYKIDGIPTAEDEARALAALDPHTFQHWAVSRLGGQPRGKGADRGIDGEIVFLKGVRQYGRGIVSVKAGQNVNPGMVRDLKGVVQREEADLGVFVCLRATKEMKVEASRSNLVELPGGARRQIQIVEVADLIAGPNLGILTELNTLQAAQHARAQKNPRRPTPEKLRTEPPLPPMPIKGGKPALPAPLQMDEPIAVEPMSKAKPGRALGS